MNPIPRMLAAALASACLAAGLARAGEPLGASIDGLLAHARANSSEFAAQRFEAEAAAERVIPAGALADPTLRTELRNVTNEGRDASPNLLPPRIGSTKYTVIQPVPFWGKRDLKREAAEAAAEEAQGRAAGNWADIAARIKIAYVQYYQVARTQRYAREVLELVDHLGAVARARYAGGLVPQQDAIRAEVETTAMKSELIALETARHHAMIRINALLARPSTAPLAEPERLRPLPAPARLDFAALEQQARARNPQLFAEEARIRAAEKTRELVYRNRFPDFALGVSPIQTRNRVGEWELMVEMNIPLQQESRRSQEREAEKNLEAARARRDSTANLALAELSEGLATLESARRIEMLTRTSLLPQAELTFEAALAGYETGKVDFATVLDAQRQIRRAKQELIRSQAEQQTRLAEIERIVGEDL
ncbi:MAG: TolC family protein [Sterolibacteriaceae bacterium MAG5]|nr:TolC family protein [Candidatus Nitricoxidireducens bremensis]